MSSVTSKPTLYDRLGGVYSIAAVVDDFIDRVMHNPVLNANAAVDEAHHRVSAAGFKYYVTEMVCWATGGPQKYTGRAMRESHEHLKITESEWVAFCKDFDDTMAKFNVPETEYKELFAIVTAPRVTSSPSERHSAAGRPRPFVAVGLVGLRYGRDLILTRCLSGKAARVHRPSRRRGGHREDSDAMRTLLRPALKDAVER